MRVRSTTQLLCYNLIIQICLLILFYFPAPAQDYPYPQSPENNSTIFTSSPIFQWKGGDQFSSYTIEIFEADYIPGNNFNSINLQDYELKYAYEGKPGYQASGLTYHELRQNMFITVDDRATSIFSYNNLFIPTSSIEVNPLNGDQYEGITYLYNDFFASIEEIPGQLVFGKFNFTSNQILSSVSLLNRRKITSNGNQNKGNEGISYNPINNKMYIVEEKNPVALYEFNAPVAPNFDQTVSLSQPFIVENTSWVPIDLAGLYHLSLNKSMSATKAGEHLLLLSEESSLLLEIDLKGNLISKYEMDINDLPNLNNDGFFKAEGITYTDGIIWVASEGIGQIPAFYYGFVNPNHQNSSTVIKKTIYQKNNITSTTHILTDCLLENNTSYCWKIKAEKNDGTTVESAYYSFIPQFQATGCSDTNACNFNSCTYECKYTDCFGICGGNSKPGSSCNDGFSSTTGDYLNNDCVCIGKGCTNPNACNYNPNAKEDNGSCLQDDCRGLCGGNVGSGSPCTISTFHDGLYDSNCVCKIKGCKDPYACNYKPSAMISDNSCKYMNNSGICACEPGVTHKALNSKYKQSFSAQKELISTVNIYNAKDITYNAGKGVTLASGFTLNAKANLTIKIKNCNP